MDECIHGMLKGYCSICKNGVTKKDDEEAEIVFVARFDGQCSACNLPINKNQYACRTDKGRTIHKGCLN